MNFSGKTAVITGAASGIGYATAAAFAEAGAAVVLADIATQKGEEAAAELRQLNGVAKFIELDVTGDDSVRAFAAQAVQWRGGVDILVNAAGWGKIEMFMDNTSDFWERVIDINLYGPINLCRNLLPQMVERKSGKIINVASDAGRVGSLGETVYSGAKGGVIGFTKALAREMARHAINVNCVCPGPTDTPLLAAVPERHRDALQKAIPMRRFAKPSEIADAVVFFASDRASYITGQILSVSGGLTMVG
jgi:2-hydroxycyclohexanecarboxyl-CoA dehydrogenase